MEARWFQMGSGLTPVPCWTAGLRQLRIATDLKALCGRWFSVNISHHVVSLSTDRIGPFCLLVHGANRPLGTNILLFAQGKQNRVTQNTTLHKFESSGPSENRLLMTECGRDPRDRPRSAIIFWTWAAQWKRRERSSTNCLKKESLTGCSSDRQAGSLGF